MGARKQRVELITYITATFLTTAGTVLCLAGLLLPYWYDVKILEGIIVVTWARLGLWQDEICQINGTCQAYWVSDDTYTRPDDLVFPYWKLVQGIETAGTATAILSLVALVPVWACYRSNSARARVLTFAMFYTFSMIAGLLTIIGCLVMSSKGNNDSVDFAPLLSGVGGTVIFISVCMTCATCRYDPTYGTLDNPVSPRFIRA